jgi:regulator of protease activity HflC (stomatin/prohibitin superfamily)
MKIIRSILALAVLAATAAACTTIPPGEAGIIVNMYGQDRGVDSYPVRTGRVSYNPWTEDVISYPCYTQSTKWTETNRIAFNDKDGQRLAFAVTIGYKVDCAKVPAFYVEFRQADLQLFTDTFLRNTASEFFNAEGGKLSAEQIYSTHKEPFLASVKERLNSRMAPYGLIISQFSIEGDIELPQSVREAVEAKVRATQNAQRVENELRETQAAAAKLVAEAEGQAKSAIAKAEGQARANALLTQSLTPALLEWRRLTIEEQKAQRWNGQGPSTILGNSATPLVTFSPKN